MLKSSGIVFSTITLYSIDHVYIYNFWYNFISFKDKMSSMLTFSNRSFILCGKIKHYHKKIDK